MVISLNTVFRFIKSIFLCMKKNMLVHLRISSENVVLYMLETVLYIFDVLFDCLTDMSFIIFDEWFLKCMMC